MTSHSLAFGFTTQVTALLLYDVDVERIYERRPRRLCPPHLVTL